MRVTRVQALAWRAQRQLLTEGAATAQEVVRRLIAVPTVSGDADLAVRRRMSASTPGEVGRALDRGTLMSTYAFGGVHLFDPAHVGTYLTLRAAGRQWERASWRTYYGLEPEDWVALRAVVREALQDGPRPRAALAAAVMSQPRFAHLRRALEEDWGTLVKPLAWQGDLCIAPSVDGVTTYRLPADLPGWGGLPDLDDAGPRAVRAYLGAYGPATRDRLHHWLGEGLSAGRRRVAGWTDALLGRREVAEIDVDGVAMLQRTDHLDDLGASRPAPGVVLVAGHDPWVRGPGTADPLVVPPAHRAPVTRGANLVLRDGVVAGTWRVRHAALTVVSTDSSAPLTPDELTEERGRLGRLLGTPLELA